MDIGKAFTFVFEDEDWIVKVLIAAAIMLVGILFSWVILIPLVLAAALLAGYGAEILRRVIQGNPKTLPAWEDWGTLIVDGLKVIVIVIVYSLPAILISACLSIPINAINQNSQSAAGIGALFSVALSCFNLLWSIFISILLPAAIAFFVADGQIGAAFRFGQIFAFVRDNLSTYLITFLLSWVASLIGALGVILCGLGWFVTTPYSIMVTAHLYGQAYLEGTGRAAQPVPAQEMG
jgi:hypothetical protein